MRKFINSLGNIFMPALLRSPLHFLASGSIMLISFTGRKSGKSYTTPVQYLRENDIVTVFTRRDRVWWKNLRGGAPVSLHLRGREIQGVAEPVAEDKQAVAAALTAHLRKSPFDAKFYDVTMDEHGKPIAEDVAQAVQTVAMIRVQLS